MIAAALGIEAIYRPCFNSTKTGVILLDLQDGGIDQGEMDLEPEQPLRGHFMGTLDKLNDRFDQAPWCWPARAQGAATGI